MRIVVNDIAASSGGAMTVLHQFFHYVQRHGSGHTWIFLLGDRYFSESDNIRVIPLPEIKHSHKKKLIFDLFTGRRLLNNLAPDLVISLQNIITFGVKAPQAVYIHQSIPFQTVKRFSFLKKSERSTAICQYLIGALICRSAKKADRVIVQTEWMRQAVAEKTGISKEKIGTAFPETEIADTMVADPCRTAFFYPTNGAVYKNGDLIVRACNLLNAQGIHDFTVSLTLEEGSVNHPNIRCVGYLNRETLTRFYCNSVLLFPSYVETVGLPLLEARACNTLILASDTPFAHEVLHEYPNAAFFDAKNPQMLAHAMISVMQGRMPLLAPTPMPEKVGWEGLFRFLAIDEQR